MIYVTVGTMHLDFPRLIREMDVIGAITGERIVAQIGMSSTIPMHCDYFDFKPREEVLAIQKEARVIVSHAGIGSVIDALRVGRPVVFVPRLKRFGEHNSNHQIEIAEAMQRRGWGRMVLDIDELTDACAEPPPVCEGYRPDRDRLIRSIRETILSRVLPM